MTGIATLRTIVLDCPEPRELADFYTRLLGGRIVYNDDDWTTVEADGGVHVSFQRVPDHRPPTWPEGSRPQQIHLDVTVEDLDAAEQAVLDWARSSTSTSRAGTAAASASSSTPRAILSACASTDRRHAPPVGAPGR